MTAKRFLVDYTPATPEQKVKIESIRDTFKAIAIDLDADLPEGAEKSAGMRHLLEAKDAFVRSVLEAPSEVVGPHYPKRQD